MSPRLTLNLCNKTCQLAGYIHKACYLGNWLIVKFISFSGTENPEFCCTTHTLIHPDYFHPAGVALTQPAENGMSALEAKGGGDFRNV